jgi:hypothetical protein
MEMSGERHTHEHVDVAVDLDWIQKIRKLANENPLDPKIRKHFWMRTQKIRKHFGSKNMKTFPKDTKTFWMRTQKAKDTKTFRMPKIRKPKRSVCPSTPPAPPLTTHRRRRPTTDDGSRHRSHRITTYCAWSNSNAPSELEKEELFGSIPD